jgi:hypothetical protein
VTLVIPEGTPTLGNTRVKVLVTMPSLTAPSLATAINAVTAIEISCHLFPEGWNPTGTTAVGTRRARLCQKSQVEVLNRTTYAAGALQYVFNPQLADAGVGNEAKLLLVQGAKLYFVERLGLDSQTVAWAATQRIRTHYLELGPQIVSGDRTDENGEFFITQTAVYVNGAGPVDGVIAA